MKNNKKENKTSEWKIKYYKNYIKRNILNFLKTEINTSLLLV